MTSGPPRKTGGTCFRNLSYRGSILISRYHYLKMSNRAGATELRHGKTAGHPRLQSLESHDLAPLFSACISKNLVSQFGLPDG
uniref:Uncharacterized protein n=1 Tax=Cannabis sativa TaxID=3483 RepID=A0A803PHH8_CANSA